MRNVIIGLSCIFFTLSGIVLYKALNIPDSLVQQQHTSGGLPTGSLAAETDGTFKKSLPREANGTHALQDAQTAGAISANTDQKRHSDTGTEKIAHGERNKASVLAVIGAGAFNSGQVVVNRSMIGTIREVVPAILSAPGYQVYVEGHTDDIPIKPSYVERYVDNKKLSFLRAKSVAAILVENGVSPELISVTGYGETRPIASNATVEGRFKNRRVEIRLVPKNKES